MKYTVASEIPTLSPGTQHNNSQACLPCASIDHTIMDQGCKIVPVQHTSSLLPLIEHRLGLHTTSDYIF